MRSRGRVVLLSLCVGLTAAGGAEASAAPHPLRTTAGITHCHNLFFSERLRAYGVGCGEARLVARRAVRHVTSDPESTWRIDTRVRGRHGRVWDCAGAGFNPLPLACRRNEHWIRLQVWAD